ncbi:uncharacterized protein BDV17DRAFT_294648 [Aspergillus undulatus]|uniref:uncharacterized protein n=1 Tax=Aspergillus undulatus TaxID=1810928 RepID=UPI003CCC9148
MATSVDTQLDDLHLRESRPIAGVHHEDVALETSPVVAGTDYRAWLWVLSTVAFTIPSYDRISHVHNLSDMALTARVFMQSFGTVQSYIYENQLGTYSAGNIGLLFDKFGPVIISLVRARITVVSFVLLAECKTYWHFLLCLGVIGALGGATIATIALSVTIKVFNRRRGMAMGLALTGSAIGSIVFPLMLRTILHDLGW